LSIFPYTAVIFHELVRLNRTEFSVVSLVLRAAEGVLFGPVRKILILSTDDIKAAYADGEVQPSAGTFPKHLDS
jgi:hypothetical protein